MSQTTSYLGNKDTTIWKVYEHVEAKIMIKTYSIFNSYTLAALASLLLLSGCAEHKKIANDLDDYSERLQSYTGITLAPALEISRLNAPDKQLTKVDIERTSINLREFYAFNDCSLNQLVAQRNTALGKMQLPSSRYAYESELIFELLACQQKLKKDEDREEKAELREKLANWTTVKQEQLPLVWANLITQSTETALHFTGGTGYISGTSTDNFQATKQALTFLLKSRTQHPVDTEALELHLQQLNNSALLAKQWRTQLLLKQELDNVSSLLTTYLNNNTCSTLKEEKSIEIMQNIFRIFFAELIQPVAGQLNRYYYELSPLVEQLANAPKMPAEFSQYLLLHNKDNYDAYAQSMQAHIKIWQQIFTRCDKAST